MITLLPEMNAPDANGASRVQVRRGCPLVEGRVILKVRLVVRGIKALSLAAARPTAIGKAVLVKSDATLFEAPAVLFLPDQLCCQVSAEQVALLAELPTARKGCPRRTQTAR